MIPRRHLAGELVVRLPKDSLFVIDWGPEAP